MVRRLNDAGAIILGKLNLTEGAMAGYNPAFDIPVNPWGADRWAGASLQRIGRGHGGGPVLWLVGQRHGRFDPVPGGGVRHGGHQADVGTGQPVRSFGAGRVAGPRGPDDPQRRGRRDHASGIWLDMTPTIRPRSMLRCRTCCPGWARASTASASAWTSDISATMWTPRWPRRRWPARVCWKAWEPGWYRCRCRTPCRS